MRRVTSTLVLVTIVAALGGCALTPEQKALKIEPLLSASGFKMLPADTPKRQSIMASVQPYELRYFIHNGKPRYIYADPKNCNCIYAGDETAYQRYEKLKIEEQLTNEQAQAAAMNQDAVMQEEVNLSAWPYDPLW
jgi:hypothetical protein